MTNLEITAKLEALQNQFKALPCDNNGNPCDWNTYDRLLTAIENCEAILDGKYLVSSANIESL